MLPYSLTDPGPLRQRATTWSCPRISWSPISDFNSAFWALPMRVHMLG